MKMKIALNKIDANPFRDIDNYEPQPDKIAALVESINETDFWENIVVRQVGKRFELAYGHHRIWALRKIHGENSRKEFDFIIKELNDDSMMKIMAWENMEEWGSDAFVVQETIRSLVKGYAEGRLHLPEPENKTSRNHIRHAPHFDPRSPGTEHPYTAETLSEYLGDHWPVGKIKTALQGLEKIEQGYLKEEDFKGLKGKHSQALTTEINRVEKAAEREAKKAETEGDKKSAIEIRKRGKQQAKQVAKKLQEGFASGDIGKRDAAVVAEQVKNPTKGPKDFPDIIPVTQRLAMRIEHLLDDDKELGEKVRAIVKHKKHLNDDTRKGLKMALGVLADEANELASKL